MRTLSRAARPHGALPLLITLALAASVSSLSACSHHDATVSAQAHTIAPPAATRAAAACGTGTDACALASNSEGVDGFAGPESVAAATEKCPDPRPDPSNPLLQPLTQDDIQLYLSVMQAAQERVQHPTAADKAALAHQRQFEKAVAAGSAQRDAAGKADQATAAEAMRKIQAAAEKGDFATAQALAKQANQQMVVPQAPTIAEPGDGDLAMSLSSGHADDVIVAERHLDAKRWARIVDVIEDVIVPPQFEVDGDGDGFAPTSPPTRMQLAIEAAEKSKGEQLAPWRKQIRALESVVRSIPAAGE